MRIIGGGEEDKDPLRMERGQLANLVLANPKFTLPQAIYSSMQASERRTLCKTFGVLLLLVGIGSSAKLSNDAMPIAYGEIEVGIVGMKT